MAAVPGLQCAGSGGAMRPANNGPITVFHRGASSHSSLLHETMWSRWRAFKLRVKVLLFLMPVNCHNRVKLDRPATARAKAICAPDTPRQRSRKSISFWNSTPVPISLGAALTLHAQVSARPLPQLAAQCAFGRDRLDRWARPTLAQLGTPAQACATYSSAHDLFGNRAQSFATRSYTKRPSGPGGPVGASAGGRRSSTALP